MKSLKNKNASDNLKNLTFYQDSESNRRSSSSQNCHLGMIFKFLPSLFQPILHICIIYIFGLHQTSNFFLCFFACLPFRLFPLFSGTYWKEKTFPFVEKVPCSMPLDGSYQASGLGLGAHFDLISTSSSYHSWHPCPISEN